MNKFFLICPIGLEDLLEIELLEKWALFFPNTGLPERKLIPGGIEITCELHFGFMLNKILKSPSKILWRLKTRKCRDLPKFYNIIKKISWRNYLNQEELQVSITAKKSRLIHTGKLEESFHKAVKDYFESNKIKLKIVEKHKDDPLQKIFLRLNNDELTISLDTSGELLHIRGDRSFRGHASIRENIASLLLTKLMVKLPVKKYNLIDPMCGTGTFLFEWQNRLKPNQRSFNYEFLSSKQLMGIPELEEVDTNQSTDYYGRDLDPLIIEKNKELKSLIDFKCQDIFKADELVDGNNILIMNPPYGKRVEIHGCKVDFFKALIKSVHKIYSPYRLGIIIPRDYVSNLKGQRIYFNQNGIEVCFLIQKKVRSELSD